MTCRAAVLTLALLAAGCAARQDSCLLPTQQKMLVLSLYFGRDVPGRSQVTDAEWQRFASDVLGRQFPEGFTVFEAAGQWRNPATGAIAREATKVVQIAAAPTADLREKIEAATAAYKRRFNQVAVGAVSGWACGAF